VEAVLLTISESAVTQFLLTISKSTRVVCADESMCFVKPDKKNLVLGRVKPDEFYLWPTYIRKKLRGMDQPTLEENLEDKCKT
jgi:hypothetical protein